MISRRGGAEGRGQFGNKELNFGSSFYYKAGRLWANHFTSWSLRFPTQKAKLKLLCPGELCEKETKRWVE